MWHPFLFAGGLPARYQFHGLHFHWGPDNAGSEHTFEGKAFAMELHLVHFNTEYGSSITQGISYPWLKISFSILVKIIIKFLTNEYVK